jgi:hypothetical protein
MTMRSDRVLCPARPWRIGHPARVARVAAVVVLGLSGLGAQALDRSADGEPPADARSPWRVWSLDSADAPAGALRWRPALAAEPHPVLGAGELPRLRPAISLSRGGPVVLSLVPRGDEGLLLTLQFTP